MSSSTIKIVRFRESSKAVLGRLYLNSVYLCDTLEPPFREQYGAIPYGRYLVKFIWSSKFKCVVPLVMVDDRSMIEIHVGNIPENSRGCILVGYNYPIVGNSLMYSKLAFQMLMINLSEDISSNLLITSDSDNYDTDI